MFVFKTRAPLCSVMIIIMLAILSGGCAKRGKQNTKYTLFKNGAAQHLSHDQKETKTKPVTKKKGGTNNHVPSATSQKALSSPPPHKIDQPPAEQPAPLPTDNVKLSREEGELDFTLCNETPQTLFVVCFSYIKKTEWSQWHWDKSPSYKLEPHQTTLVNIDTIPSPRDRKNVFATLGFFTTEEEAKQATLPSLEIKDSLHLGYLHTFKNKIVMLTIEETERSDAEGKRFSFHLKDPYGKRSVSEKIEELDFEVQNATGQTIFVACFSYIKKQEFSHWRWDKSPIYKIANNESVIIDVDTIPDPVDRQDVFGYLGIFQTFEEAEEATFELLSDTESIDLDLLYKLKQQKVVLTVERYGFKGQNFDFSLKKIMGGPSKAVKELDFMIENQTGKDIYVTCFSYEHKNPAMPWQFDKTPVVFLPKGKSTLIDIATIVQKHDRNFTQAFLAVFDSDEKEKAENSTFQLLKPTQKIALGPLVRQINKKIILYVEHYGVAGEIIDYTAKSVRKIIPGTKVERNSR